jgi:hypothetical protein
MLKSLNQERAYPLIFALAIGAGAWLMGFSFPDDKKELLAAVVSFGAILAGFIGTAQTILMALPQRVLGKLQNSGYMENLSAYLASALLGSLLISAASIAGFFNLPPIVNSYYPPLWAGIFVYAALTFWRVSRIVVLLLRIDPETL